MYKLTIPMNRSQEVSCVIRISDSACIPFDPVNADYKAYLIWLEEGNTPEPAEAK
jgi:hypothetical protein